jgi:archaetidylinositol phosphate synthase
LVFTGLGLSPYVRLDLATLALAGYLMMSILTYVEAYVSGKFQLSYAKVGPTEMRLIAIVANILVYFLGNPVVDLSIVSWTVFDLIVAVIAALLFVVFITTTTRKALYWREIDKR